MNEPLERRGIMLVLSSPSGAGKSSLARALMGRYPEISLSISATTRSPRPSETDGVHYHFVDADRFEGMVRAGELLEHAEVHGNFYGTPRREVEKALIGGRDVLFDIDWQGARQIADKMPEDLVRVFVLPPSMAELRQRLLQRGEDAPETIARRLANARDEMARWSDYDYVLVNTDFEATLAEVEAIYRAERCRRGRMQGLGAFVENLLADAPEVAQARGA